MEEPNLNYRFAAKSFAAAREVDCMKVRHYFKHQDARNKI
jgi:hypothetical protein